MVAEANPCQKHRYHCFCGVFSLVLIAACGYLFYGGWWLPIAMNRHRLRHTELNSFELYSLSASDWSKYNMAEEGLSMIIYRQEQPLDYEFLLGIFLSSSTSVPLPPWSLVQFDWPSFVDVVDSEDFDEEKLYIFRYSQRDCASGADCFDEWLSANNDSNTDKSFVCAEIEQRVSVDIDSISTSDALDGPRDIFVCTSLALGLISCSRPECAAQMFIMMLFCFIWFILVIDFFEDKSIEMEGVNYLVMTVFFIGAYYLWVCVLAVVPVLFALPVAKENADYWDEALYSLSFVAGDYNPRWWVTGVLLSGIWSYSLVRFMPALGLLYLLVASLYVLLCCSRTIPLLSAFLISCTAQMLLRRREDGQVCVLPHHSHPARGIVPRHHLHLRLLRVVHRQYGAVELAHFPRVGG